MQNEEAHRLAREKGVSKPLYAFVRALLAPFMRIHFRMHIAGAEHIPAEGPAIVAPNHKSFYDSFFIAVCTCRRLRFGEERADRGSLRTGPREARRFPVRRGQSDAEALETARAILRQGELLALFPEGTRVRDPEGVGHPKRGAGHIALDTGAPLIPCAITGTEALFAGPFPKPRRVQVRSPSRSRWVCCRRARRVRAS